MKRAIILFWKGLTGIISVTAEWFTVILGMKDESKYGKFIRRVVGGCFAFIMFVFACAGGNAPGELRAGLDGGIEAVFPVAADRFSI